MVSGFFSAQAQFYNGHNLSFGQNRIQYAQRVWNCYRTPAADIYYYRQGKELADFSALRIHSIVAEMETKTGMALQNKIQLIVYARQSDYMQSNIGLEDDNFYNIGGITPVYGDKIILYFDGNISRFLEDLRGGIAGLFVNRLTIGNGLAASMKAGYVSDYPEWFTAGAAAFLSQEWTDEHQNMFSRSFDFKQYRKLYRLNPARQRLAGFAFWRQVAQKHGANAVTTALYYAGVLKNYERGFQYAVGEDFKTFFRRWLLESQAESESFSPDKEGLDTEWFRFDRHCDYLHPLPSPEGDKLACVVNRDGRVKVCLIDLKTRKKTVIYRLHYPLEDRPDYTYPLLAWHPSGESLTMITRRQDKTYLVSYLLKEKKWNPRQVLFLNQVKDFSYDAHGRRIALTGIDHGQSDVYVYHISSRSLKRITDDKADDCGAVFVQGGQMLAFASNRSSDTLGVKDDYSLSQFDLFLYDLDNPKERLLRLTQTADRDESCIVPHGENRILYTGQKNGTKRRYEGTFENVLSRVDTALHYEQRLLGREIAVYRGVAVDHPSMREGDTVMYQQYFCGGRWIIAKESVEGRQGAVLPTEESLPETEIVPPSDAVSAPSSKRFRQVRFSDAFPRPQDSVTAEQVGRFTMPLAQDSLSLIPRGYQVQYFISKIAAQVDFSLLGNSYQPFDNASSPLFLNPGMNGFVMVEIRDLLEDFRMSAGGRISIDLNNIECFYSYENLRLRLDRQILIHYRTHKHVTGETNIRQQEVTAYYRLKYPFDRVQSLQLSAALRYEQSDSRAFFDLNVLRQHSQRRIWGSLKAEYTFDATRPLSVNMLRGLRGKVFAEAACTPTRDFHNMLVLGFDFRYYLPLGADCIWANRLAGSASLGRERLIYYLGGVDNWMIPKFGTETPVDSNINYAYQTLATPLRGFSQNIRNGTNFAVLNSELRFGIVQAFSGRPLRSRFLRTFHVVLFGDVGTAWSGWNPYDDKNALFTRTVTQGDVTVTFRREVNPIVGGFGVGARFMLFSYLIRFDYGWGVSGRKVNKGMAYLSLSLDF
jgi:hypothetical protein